MLVCVLVCFFNDTATPEIYTYCHTLSLPDALPIWTVPHPQGRSTAEDGQSRASCLARKAREPSRGRSSATPLRDRRTPPDPPRERSVQGDRKSTRLNSSH